MTAFLRTAAVTLALFALGLSHEASAQTSYQFTDANGAKQTVTSKNCSSQICPVFVPVDSNGNAAAGTLGSAVPLAGNYFGASSSGNLTGVVACDKFKFIHVTSATDTLVVQGVSAQQIKICGAVISFQGTATAFLENTASTNANCASSNTQIGPLWSGVAQTQGGFQPTFWMGLANTIGNGLCANSTGTGGFDLSVWYTQGS